jgi:1-acyl-sn-glycerol-3-phosphate acyltransferase
MIKTFIKSTWHRLASFGCTMFCRTLLNLEIEGIENLPKTGPYLLISNHQSYFDPIFCGIPLRRTDLYFLARDTLFRNKFFSFLISSLNAIPVKRGQSDMTALKTVIKRLKEGYVVCLFPEGTRTLDGKILDFKPGLGLICRRGGAIVVPTVIDGAFEVWPKKKKLFSTGTVAVCYGKPMSTAQVKELDDNEIALQLTQTLRNMQNEYRIRHGKTPFIY